MGRAEKVRTSVLAAHGGPAPTCAGGKPVRAYGTDMMTAGEDGWVLLGLFEKKRTEPAGTAVQLRDGGRHPFGMLDGYVPLRNGEIALYRSIREAVPIVDAAVLKLIRLAGGVRVTCREKAAQAGLDRFLRTVNTGRGQRGIQSFLDCYLDSMLTCGRAVGEILSLIHI